MSARVATVAGLALLVGACAGSPAAPAEPPPPVAPTVSSPPPTQPLAPPAASAPLDRAAREQRVIRLLEGREPE